MTNLHPKDYKLFSSYINDTLDPQAEWKLAAGTIEKEDFRINKPSITGGIENESREFLAFKNSSSYKDTIATEALLSKDFSVSQEQLSQTLKRTGKNENEIRDIISNLSNHRDVICNKNSFTSEVTFRKR